MGQQAVRGKLRLGRLYEEHVREREYDVAAKSEIQALYKNKKARIRDWHIDSKTEFSGMFFRTQGVLLPHGKVPKDGATARESMVGFCIFYFYLLFLVFDYFRLIWRCTLSIALSEELNFIFKFLYILHFAR